MLNELSRELAASGVGVVGVNFDDDPRDITLGIAERLGIEFYTLTAQEFSRLGLRAPDVMPTTFLLSPRNETAAILIGLQSREQILEQLSRLGILPEEP